MARSRTTFRKGARYPGQGGKREKAGRPTNAQQEEWERLQKLSEQAKQQCADRTLARIAKEMDGISKTYTKLAKDGKSPATTRHAIEYVIPPLTRTESKQSVVFVTSLPVEEI